LELLALSKREECHKCRNNELERKHVVDFVLAREDDRLSTATHEHLLYLVHRYIAVFGHRWSLFVFVDSGILLRLHILTYPVAMAWSPIMLLFKVSDATRNESREAHKSGIIGY
jgi:hypothetical protein